MCTMTTRTTQTTITTTQTQCAKKARPELDRMLSRERNQEYYNRLFEKADADGSGGVSREELARVMRENKAPPRCIDELFEQGDRDHDGQLQRDEFIDLVTANPQLFKPWEIKMMSMISKCVPYKPPPEDDHSEYHKAIKFCPPPLLVVSLTLFQITFFFLNTKTASGDVSPIMGKVARALMFDPARRVQVWRYFTYMLVHASPVHLAMNMCVQLFSGVTLELVHGWRILAIYCAGVVGGSLWSSIVESTSPLVGASAGVYALITALIANIILNWGEMSTPSIPLVALTLYAVCDISLNIYESYYLSPGGGGGGGGGRDRSIGITAHASGAILGALTGLVALKNLKVLRFETKMQHWAVLIVVASSSYALLYNIYQMIVFE